MMTSIVQRKWLRYGMPLIILLIAFLLSRLIANQKESIEPQWLKPKVYDVTALSIQAGTHYPIQQLFASLSPLKKQRLVAFTTGEIASAPFDSGQWAQPGETLIAFKASDINLQIDLAKASVQESAAEIERTQLRQSSLEAQLIDQQKLLSLRHKQLEREKALSKGQYNTQNTLDSAEQVYLQQRLVVNGVKEQISALSVSKQLARAKQLRAKSELDRAFLDKQRSLYKAEKPLLIIKNQTKVGSIFSAGSQLMETLALEDFELEAALVTDQAQSLIENLNKEQRLTATTFYLGEQLVFNLQGVKGDATSGSLVGIFKPQRLDQSALHGLRLGVSLPLSLRLPAAHNTFAIPFSSLYGRDKIYAIESGMIKRISVQYLGTVEAPNSVASDHYWALVRLPSSTQFLTLLTTHLPNAGEGLRVNVIP